MRTLGRLISDSGGREHMVVFSDYECPACRAFHGVVRELERDFPGVFEVRLIHMPLGYHRFARPSARLAECAAAEGRFRHATDVLFAMQDSLGLLSWSDMARSAKVSDPERVASCANEGVDSRFPRIDEGLRMSEEINARGTPTVVIGGRKYHGIPTRNELERIARGE